MRVIQLASLAKTRLPANRFSAGSGRARLPVPVSGISSKRSDAILQQAAKICPKRRRSHIVAV